MYLHFVVIALVFGCRALPEIELQYTYIYKSFYRPIQTIDKIFIFAVNTINRIVLNATING